MVDDSEQGSALDAFKFGFKGLRSSVASAVASADESHPEDDRATNSGDSSGSWLAWADKARKAVSDKAKEVAYEVVPQNDVSARDPAADSTDVERGDGLSAVGVWASRLGKQVSESVDIVGKATEKGLERAKTLEFGEQAKRWQSDVAGGLNCGFSSVASAGATATAAFGASAAVAQQKAKDAAAKSQQKLGEANAMAAKKALEAKDKASSVAGSAKDKLSAAGSSLHGMGALAASPAKLAQFAAVFVVGTMLISLSFSFLPMLPVAPQKFALLFAFGSMTMMTSFAMLKGPQNFLGVVLQRELLPFSVAYVVGLVGTLGATIVLRSYLLTSLFGLTQALALLYFMASFVPGGKSVLNMCGRSFGRLAHKLMCQRSKQQG